MFATGCIIQFLVGAIQSQFWKASDSKWCVNCKYFGIVAVFSRYVCDLHCRCCCT